MLVIPSPHAISVGKKRSGATSDARQATGDREGLPVSPVLARELIAFCAPLPLVSTETLRQIDDCLRNLATNWSFHEALTEKSRDRGRPPVIVRATGRRFIRQEKVYKANEEGILASFSLSFLPRPHLSTSTLLLLLQLSLVLSIYHSHSKMVKLTSAFIALACAVSSCMASPVVTERAVSATCPRYT